MGTSGRGGKAQTSVDVDTRQRLIDETLATIPDRGVAAVRIDEITAAVNVTKGSLYWHFTDREALIRAALGEHLRRLSEGSVAGISEAISTATSRDDYLSRIAPLLTDPFDSDRVTDRWRTWELFLEARKDPLLAEMMRDVQTRNLHVFIELMEAAQERGILRPDVDTRAVATMLSVVNLGSNAIEVFGDEAPSPEAWWGLLLFFIGSLFPDQPDP